MNVHVSNPLQAAWGEALHSLLQLCVPAPMRERVLADLLEQERTRKPLRIISYDELMAMDLADYRTKKDAASLMVQVLVRSITNNFSKEDAAEILFRDHYGLGTGSGWLPDYLHGLPGITVDLKKCAEIADAAGPSLLREAMQPVTEGGAR